MSHRREPKYIPYFRGKKAKRVQDGFRVSWYEDGAQKPSRKWVKTEPEAILLTENKRTAFALKSTGLRLVTTQLQQGHIRHVEDALHILENHSFLNFHQPEEASALVKAVEWFVAHYVPEREDMPTVSSLMELFFISRKRLAPQTLQDYRKNMGIFAKATFLESHEKGRTWGAPDNAEMAAKQTKVGDMRIDLITGKHVTEFLDSRPGGKTTKAKYFGAIRALFYFAIEESDEIPLPFLSKNPALLVRRPPRATTPKRHRYTLQEVRDLIQVSIYLRCAPLVVLRLYTMLRAVEADRLINGPATTPRKGPGRPQKNDPWQSIDLHKEQKEGDRKGMLEYHETNEEDPANRDITLYPSTVTWLTYFKEHKIPFSANRQEEYARRVAVPRKFGPEYPNVIRHTAISFRACYCQSLLETASEADNTETIIKKHYFRKVSEPDAEAFYQLTPDKFDLRPFTEQKFPSERQLAELKLTYPGIEKYLEARS